MKLIQAHQTHSESGSYLEIEAESRFDLMRMTVKLIYSHQLMRISDEEELIWV